MDKAAKGMLYAAGGTVLAAALVSAGSYGLRVSKNPPPFVSEKTFTDALIELRAGQKTIEQENRLSWASAAVSSAWWRCVNAIESDQSRQAVDALSSDFGNAKVVYEALAGKSYPFECPMPQRR